MKKKSLKTISKTQLIKNKTSSSTVQQSFPCNDCNFQLDTAEELQCHRDMVHNISQRQSTEALICEQCGKTFETAAILRRHIKYHADDKPFKCSQCDKQFIQQALLDEHYRIHTGYKPFQCNVCQKSFRKAMNLKIHSKTHTGEKPYKCSICDKSFSQQGLVKRHMRTHTNERPYACPECPKTFTQSSGLNTHVNRRHSKNAKYSCNLCTEKFNFSRSLVSHMKTHHVSEVRAKYSCSLCSKQFTQSHNLSKHMKVHEDTQDIPSTPCNDSQKMISKHQQQQQQQTENNGKMYKCNECDLEFSASIRLAIHARSHSNQQIDKFCGNLITVDVVDNLHQSEVLNLLPSTIYHENNQQIKTNNDNVNNQQWDLQDIATNNNISIPQSITNFDSDAGKIFKQPQQQQGQSSIQQLTAPPQQQDSTSYKPFQCNVCLKRFLQAGNLKIHMKIHTGEKPYPCSFCGKKFSQPNQVTRHIRIHTNERPYMCTECPKTFSQGAHLKTHLRIHFKVRCEQCLRRFTRPEALERHKKTHDKVQKSETNRQFSCLICLKKFTRAYFLNIHMKRHDISVDNKNTEQDNVGEVEKKPPPKPPKPIVSKVTYKCSDCCEEFSSIHGLAIHIRRYAGKRHDAESVKPIIKSRKTRTVSSSASSSDESIEHSISSSNLSPVSLPLSNPPTPSPSSTSVPPLSSPTPLPPIPIEINFNDSTKKNNWLYEKSSPNKIPPDDHQSEIRQNELLWLSLTNHDETSNSKIKDKSLLVIESHKPLKNPITTFIESPQQCNTDGNNETETPTTPPPTTTEHPQLTESKVKQIIQPKLLLLCCICKSISFDHEIHRNHMKFHLLELAKFKCDVCDLLFKTNFTLNIHRRIHLYIPKYICYICKKMYKDLSQLKTHMRTHSVNKPYECDCTECRNEVEQKRPFECTICLKRYTRKDRLIRHEKIHYTAGNLQCTNCDRKYVNAKALESHLKTHLNVKKTNVCKICDKEFAKSFVLNRHMKIHSR